jgi:UMP-CMP kinase
VCRSTPEAARELTATTMFGRLLQRCTKHHARLAAACTATAAAATLQCSGATAKSFTHSSATAPTGTGKVVHELSFSVSPTVAGDFRNWLRTYLKSLLELPGAHGAKVLATGGTGETEAPKAKPGVVFVLGGPGAGKGTQCGRLVEQYQYTHLSAGDLLRAERKSGSAQGQMIDEYIKEGKIVPVEVTVRLLINAIKADGGSRFLVDGFPRNTNNLSGWQQEVGDELQLGGVLFYDCPEDVMEARLLERGKSSGRTDDNIESIRKRFITYQNETTPILSYYDHQGLCHKIDGARDVEEVWKDTVAARDAIEKRLSPPPPPPSMDSSTVAHIYASADGGTLLTSDALAARVNAAASKRFGEGAVACSVRTLSVEGSLKAYGIETLRAFD